MTHVLKNHPGNHSSYNGQSLADMPRPSVAPRNDNQFKATQAQALDIRNGYRHLLDAFEHARYGRLLLTLPDGAFMNCEGIEEGPTADLHIHDWRAFDALLTQGQVGFANAYAEGMWDSDDMPGFFAYGLKNVEQLERYFYGKPLFMLGTMMRSLLSGNNISRARRNVLRHYDVGNPFYALWLDKGMTYSCALFEGNEKRTLEEAQVAKYNRIFNKLDLPLGSHILDIGCGWGAFAEAAALRGYHVTAITISEAQGHFAMNRLQRGLLTDRADVKLMDYRLVTGVYDAVVSIGMFEHVGEAYWSTYFKKVASCLKPGGKAMIQTIALDDDVFEKTKGKRGFVEEMIFPGCAVPSRKRFKKAAEGAGMKVKEMFTFGQDYVRTLREWHKRFESNKQQIIALGYDSYFIRLWRMYLTACIASFDSGRSTVMQAELIKQDDGLFDVMI